MHIDDKTTIPLLTVLTALPVLVGLIIWLSVIASTTNANSAEIMNINNKAIEQTRLLSEIKQDVAYIRGKLDTEKR